MDLYKIAQSVFTEIEAEVNETTKWKSDSKYIKIRHLQIDKRGSFKERLIRDIFAKKETFLLSIKTAIKVLGIYKLMELKSK
ncbi:hypothetical protein V5K36_001181 [Campylobacter upsaliensis]